VVTSTGAATTTFGRARRRRAYRELGHRVGLRSATRALLPLDEAERRLRPFNRHHVGLRAIPVGQIVGTDGRGNDFDRDFLPLRPGMRERWRRVEQAFPDGDFPPIVAYRLGDAYFVLDGHHRVALARQRGMRTIDADVTELHARFHLPADADLVELVQAEQQRFFLEESGLAATPEPIRLSSPAGYLELLENVQIHGYHLVLEAGRVLTREAIAADWYERIYVPAIAAIQAEGLDGVYPDATPADLFLHVHRRRRAAFPDDGCPSLERVVQRLATEDRRSAIVRTLGLRRGGRAPVAV
jgi:hypothetical protein